MLANCFLFLEAEYWIFVLLSCKQPRIQWQGAALAHQSKHDPFLSGSCSLGVSAGCGTTPISEDLPTSCVNLAQPAVFSYHDSGDTEIVKFFDSGEGEWEFGRSLSRSAGVVTKGSKALGKTV